MTVEQQSHWITRIVKAVTLAFALGLLALASRAYYSEHLFVMAEGGRKTVSDYERLLLASVQANPWNGSAHLRYSDLLLSRGQFEDSLRVLQSSSPGKNHWQGWERAGTARERIAYQDYGTEEDIELATDHYNDVLRVYPTYERGLERRAVLALRAGEWTAVDDIADQLQELDANNQNVIYMRARAADARGNYGLASQLFGQLSSRNSQTTNALFTRQEVLNRLSKVVERSL